LVLALSNSRRAQQSLRLSFYPANDFVLQNHSPEFPPIGAAYSFMRSQVMAERYAHVSKRDRMAEVANVMPRRVQTAALGGITSTSSSVDEPV
jgi:hypothetical protein